MDGTIPSSKLKLSLRLKTYGWLGGKDAGAIHRCRNCKHQKAKMKELGLDMGDDKGYDLHNEENIHNAVTDVEASKPNQPNK